MIKYSIVVPVAPYRDAEVLSSVKNLNYPKDKHEVIIEEGTNPSENRNEGVRRAKGDIVAFLDDDAILPEDLLKNASSFFKEHPEVDIVGGPQLTPSDDPFFAKISGYTLSSFFGTFSMSKRYKKAKISLNADETSLTSAICFMKKTVFDRIEGFNPKLFPGEDPEFFARAKEKNLNLAYSPDLYIYHRRRPTFTLFFKQIFTYGVVRLKKEKFSNALINPVFFTPTLFVIYLISLPFLLFFSLLFLLPLLLYVLLALIFSIPHIFKNKSAIFIMPFLFFLVHIAYGAGMVRGLFKK